MRWHGGKWMLAPWIIAHFPRHHVYVEPFGGAASILLRKKRAYAEIYNDLDSEAVNLFEVLRDPMTARALTRALELTPFARVEFEAAYRKAEQPIERARRLVIRSFMGFGSAGATGEYRTGFRANSSRRGSTPAADWRNYPTALAAITDRLRGVVIESRDAIDVMVAHDGENTLHYVDPPYMLSTRTRTHRWPGGGTYRHELSDAQHGELLEHLCVIKGMVVLSGYRSDIYDAMLGGWHRVERAALADGARKRVEQLWLNPAAFDRLDHHQPSFTLDDPVPLA